MSHERPIRILFVEDDPSVRQVIATVLGLNGYDVATAIDGFDALRHLHQQLPDLVLTDLNMPAMSGFELLSVVRRRFPQIVSVAASAAYSSGSVPLGVTADGFYSKGQDDPAALLEVIAQALRTGPVRHDGDTVPA